MFNVAVLKMKDIIKFLIIIMLLVLLISLSAKYISSKNKKETEKTKTNQISEKLSQISGKSLNEILGQTMTVMSSIKEETSNNEEKENYAEKILKTEISAIGAINKKNSENANEGTENNAETQENEQKNQNNEGENTEENNQNNQEPKIETAQTGLQTEVVTNNPITESFNVQYGNVKIKNQTSYTLTEDILKPDITIENKNIILFHTHSCESYTSSDLYPYTPTGNFRTTDLNFTVTRVGTELEQHLKNYGSSVTHDATYHDYPSYNGSYTNSLKTVENILQTYKADIIIDLHRDAIGSREDYAPTVKIGEDYAAQLMFVIGTNEGGLYHPNWNQNLKFAVMLQQKAEEMYPGLFKPLMLTTSRYNQHTGKFASIIEVGATGNTLEQCLTSMKYLAKVMDEILK